MAKFHYTLTGEEPIVKDVPVYDAATLVQGEFVMLDPAAATDCRFITGYTSDNTEMLDGLGIMNETLTTTSKADYGDAITTAATANPDAAAIGSIAATLAQGHKYGKVIINPFAVYLTEYSQAAADDVAFTGAWSTTTLTVTSLEDNIDGGWVYVADASANALARGQLRYLSASASGSATTDSAPTVATATSDTFIKILPIAHRLTEMNAAGTGLMTVAIAGTGVALTIVENYIGGTNIPLESLRAEVHEGVDYGAGTKFYADVLLNDHLYNPA